MSTHPQNLHPFSEPLENYTRVPNEYFDKYLKDLTPAENKVIQHIIRKTWGWQRPFACISIPRFVRTTGLTKNTVKTAIKGLLNSSPTRPQLILRYETGTGSNRRSYFWIKTEKNYNIYKAIIAGSWKIEDAYELLCPSSGNKAKVIHTDQAIEGLHPDPSEGSKIDPSARAPQGSTVDPRLKKRAKERRNKGEDPPQKLLEKASEAEANAAERFREQRLTQNRRAEQSGGSFSAMSELTQHLHSRS